MAREEDIYRLMDQRDQSLCCTGFCLAAVAVSIYFLMQGLSWERIYFLAVSGIGSILLSWHTWKENRRIMEAGCCYMELDGESLAVCQPEQDGRYESCRLFYNEVEKIVEGSRKGIPEFYVVVCPDPGRESFILLDDEEQARQIFALLAMETGSSKSSIGGCAGRSRERYGFSVPNTRLRGIKRNPIRGRIFSWGSSWVTF